MEDRKKKLISICDTLMYYMEELIGQASALEDIGCPDLADDLRMTASNIEDLVDIAQDYRYFRRKKG